MGWAIQSTIWYAGMKALSNIIMEILVMGVFSGTALSQGLVLSGTALSHAKLFLAISQCQRTFSIFIYLFNVYWKTYFLANLTENESKSTRLKKGIELLSVHSSFRDWVVL